MKYREIEDLNELKKLLNSHQHINSYAFQDIDFNEASELLTEKTFSDCIFLGCEIPHALKPSINKDCYILPRIDAPFNPFISKLYNRKTLLGNYKPGNPESYEQTYDKVVYNHYIKTGKEADDIRETLTRRLHDHSITDALYDFLEEYDDNKIVAIMGGHSMARNDTDYLELAQISKSLTEQGYLMISGGGPGAMEATHLGAYFAGKDEEQLLNSIKILSKAPIYKDKNWLDAAFEVIYKYTESEFKSIGIPTWLYGHEPPTPFASHIAKYFANSVREDGLLAIAKGGVIFSPGSAGTIQEIFQDATQNHYLTFGIASPMVFYKSTYWTEDRPVYPLLKKMVDQNKYQNIILSLCNNSTEVIRNITNFSPLNT
jgi:predicted Rossmann-fold nucleotide-binding protein